MQYINANGMQMPSIGFGTFELSSEDTPRMVREALAIGYRHIDTAQMYENEAEVGQAIEDSDVSRDDVFLTTKLWTTSFQSVALKKSTDESLQKLRTDYVDLLLLHWPNPDVALQETLDALMQVQQAGKAKHIGVSNFPVAWLKQAHSICGDGKLACNQVEYHVFLTQHAVLAKVDELGMALTAYSPLARGKIMGDEILKSIGETHNKNEAQVALRWLVQQKNVAAIPKTTNKKHAELNFDIFDFELSDQEVQAINAKLQGNNRVIDPSFAPEWDRH